MRGFSFYRPEFLWAILFCAAILAIHLLRRPRIRTLEFSTLRFFQAQSVQASRMRRLRKVLLLLARLLAAATLVMLFAQPFNKNNRLSLLRDPHLTLLTWIDRTPSMEYSEHGRSLLKKAGAVIDSVASACPATVKRLCYDEGREEFVTWDPARPPIMRTRHGPAALDRVIRAYAEARGNYSLPVLLLCSDFQRSTTGCLDTLLPRLLSPKRPPVICVNLSPRAPWNYSIGSAELHESGSDTKVKASVKAEGRRLDSSDVTVTVADIRAGRQRVAAAANDSASIEIPAPGLLKAGGGMVALAADDPMPFDNTAYFAAQNRTAERVIVVGDSDLNYPVAAAFSAAGPRRWNPVTMRDGDAVTYDELDSADIIVVNALRHPSMPLEALRRGRSFAGKVVVFALGGDEKEFGRSVNFLSKVVDASARVKLSPPAPVTGETPASTPAATPPATILLPDTISETWRGFSKTRTSEAAIYRYAEGLPGTTLLSLNTGAPLITTLKDDDGRYWILIGTPIGVTSANNLCETGFFVPCLDRIVRSVAAKTAATVDPWIAGFERRNPLYGSGKSASVLNREGKFIERWQSQPLVVFKEPGSYKIVPDKDTAYWLTVKADPSENTLQYGSPIVPDALKSSLITLDEQQIIEAANHGGRLPSYLPWFLLALLLLAEVFLWERADTTPTRPRP